ncbi:DNA alkylation repair protein [Candidatus Margulisiibacteriota bacterium]
MNYQEILRKIKSQANPRNVLGMARYGINPQNNYGLCMGDIMSLARQIGQDHALAGKLWASGIRDARILASMVDDPAQVTSSQMDKWAKDLNSWDVCDSLCGRLFDRTKYTQQKIVQWSKRKEEYVKRAAFSIIAWLVAHDKKIDDKTFLNYLKLVKKAARDERNYVKKAVNWALRSIGKRNMKLNKAAIKTARDIAKLDSKAAKWNAKDTLRELTGKKVQARLRRKKK